MAGLLSLGFTLITPMGEGLYQLFTILLKVVAFGVRHLVADT